MSCARRCGAELVTCQAAEAPLIEHMCAHALVERNRRLVPVEHGPLHAAAVPALGDRRDVGEQLFADSAAPPLRDDEQIFEIQTVPAEERREIVEEEREANRHV